MLFRSFPQILNICILVYVSRRKTVKVPWAKFADDPCSWIEPECVLDGFQWANPSKIRIGDIFPLFKHWRERHRQRLSPLIWVSTCPFFRHSSPSFEDRQRYRSDRSTGSSSSDDVRSETSSPNPHPNSDNSRFIIFLILILRVPTLTSF